MGGGASCVFLWGGQRSYIKGLNDLKLLVLKFVGYFEYFECLAHTMRATIQAYNFAHNWLPALGLISPLPTGKQNITTSFKFHLGCLPNLCIVIF